MVLISPLRATLDKILTSTNATGSEEKGWSGLCPGHADHRNSLSIALKDGRIILNCHAGCSIENVVQALDLEMADLFEKSLHENRIVAEYDYQDADGQVVYQVVRYEPKTFRQRRLGENGEWIWNTNGVSRFPFHLPLSSRLMV